MSHPFRKFVAVLLAIWLPLFSGSVLAGSVVMQSRGGDCHAAQAGAYRTHPASSAHGHTQHTRLAVYQDSPAAHAEQQNSRHDQQNFPLKNCGVCQFACCGYLLAVTATVAEAQLQSSSFASPSTQFQSFTSAPPDPPPLSRA